MYLLSVTILPQRLNAIQNLNIEVGFGPLLQSKSFLEFNWSAPHWERVCHTLAGMRGLKRLHVIVSITQRNATLNSDQESAILEPLIAVKQPKSFVVNVSWWREERGVELKQPPFQIVHLEDSVLPHRSLYAEYTASEESLAALIYRS